MKKFIAGILLLSACSFNNLPHFKAGDCVRFTHHEHWDENVPTYVILEIGKKYYHVAVIFPETTKKTIFDDSVAIYLDDSLEKVNCPKLVKELK